MLAEVLPKIIAEYGLKQYKIFRDIDGPGAGNGAIMEREERPKEGGRLVWLYGYKYPYKGMPGNEEVAKFCIVKKIILNASKIFSNKTMGALIVLLLISPFKKIAKKSIVDFFYDTNEWLMYDCLLKPERYCPCVKELYRALTAIIDKEKDETDKRILTLIRDVLCFFIEIDSAYKFRFQDIIPEIRKEELLAGRARMVKEIFRIFNILITRQTGHDTLIIKWEMFKSIFSKVLWIGSIRKKIQEIVKEIDLTKLTPDEGDKYYYLMRGDYDFGGKTLAVRMEEKKQIDGPIWDKYNFEELRRKFTEQYSSYTFKETRNPYYLRNKSEAKK